MMTIDLGKETAHTLIPKAKEILGQVLHDYEESFSIYDDDETKKRIENTKKAITAIEDME